MRYAIILGCLFCFRIADAQPAPPERVIVDQISIEGNKHTRASVILRELPFTEGDTLPVEQLSNLLERGEQLVLNTGLFNRASILFKNWEGSTNRIHLILQVEETWYLYPVPIFELADRNFNVWWVEQKRSLQRVNYGLEFTHLNTTGRRDRLQLTLTNGYTHQYSLRYSLPYINARQTIGVLGEVAYYRNREINFATQDNKQAFFRDDKAFVYDRFASEMGVVIRPGLRTSHLFTLGYYQNRIDERVAREQNPDFFLNGRTLQRFFSLAYRYAFENRDARFYPWKGNYFRLVLEKDGLGIFDDRNALTLFTRYDHHFPIADRWSLAMSWRLKTSLIRRPQPYNDYRAVGFSGNTPHGLEYYVIDGLDMGLFFTSLHYSLLGAEINFGRLMPIKAFRRMPIKAYLSLNNDFGYVNDPFAQPLNTLHNTALWGGGLGLDLVFFYNKVIRVEYSLNHLWENGLFLHLDFNI